MISKIQRKNILFSFCFLISTSVCHAIIGGGQGANSGPGPGPFGGGACKTLFSGNFSHQLDIAPINQMTALTQLLSIPSSPKELIEIDEYKHTFQLHDLNTNKIKQIHSSFSSKFNNAIYGLFKNYSLAIPESFHVLDREHFLVIHPDGNYYLVNFRTEQVVGRPMTFSPKTINGFPKVQITLSPDRQYFYVLERDLSRITRVEWRSGQTLQIPLRSASSSSAAGAGPVSLVKQAMAGSTYGDFFKIPDPQSGIAYFSSERVQDIYQVDLSSGLVTKPWARPQMQRSSPLNSKTGVLTFDLGPHHADKFMALREQEDPTSGSKEFMMDLIYLENPVRVETKKFPSPRGNKVLSLTMTADGSGLYVVYSPRYDVALMDLKSMKIVNTDPFQFPMNTAYEIGYLSPDSLFVRQDYHFSIFKR